MTIIDLTNHSQLPSCPLIGYINIEPEMAAAEHQRNYGPVENVYRVTRGNWITLYIPKGLEDETRKAEAPRAHPGAPS
jgi:hypothetical protein